MYELTLQNEIFFENPLVNILTSRDCMYCCVLPAVVIVLYAHISVYLDLNFMYSFNVQEPELYTKRRKI